MIDQKLISHQVFETIQGGISDNPMRKGTIIFANKFTGEPVEMSEELRVAINMDGTFIGNNPINQLEKALAGVPGGPWFIDVRNEILYIHIELWISQLVMIMYMVLRTENYLE
jgi:hypothetical protein